MARTAVVVLALLSATVVFAADTAIEEPTLTLYADVLLQLRRQSDDPTPLLTLQPPPAPDSAAHRAAMDKIVDFVAKSAARDSATFGTAHNYYLALWTRYVYFGDENDAVAAFAQLGRAADLAQDRPADAACCAFERGKNIMALPKELALKITGKEPEDAAIEQFQLAKLKSLSKGYYAARSALALADLYINKADAKNAKASIREALELDPSRGYVWNQAYDRLGLVLHAEGNTDGAVTMLKMAANVHPDTDIKVAGLACRLARALIESGTYEEPIKYLGKAVALADDGKAGLRPELVYALALGYTRSGNTGRALQYWKRYLDMNDPDPDRRKQAREVAESLAMSAE